MAKKEQVELGQREGSCTSSKNGLAKFNPIEGRWELGRDTQLGRDRQLGPQNILNA